MQTENNITGAEFLSDLNVLLSTSVGLNRNVKLALKKLGEHERADQVYIVSINHDMTFTISEEWTRTGESVFPESGEKRSFYYDRKLEQDLERDNYIYIRDINDVTNESLKNIMRALGVNCAIFLPLYISSHLFSFLCLSRCHHEEPWSGEEIAFLGTGCLRTIWCARERVDFKKIGETSCLVSGLYRKPGGLHSSSEPAFTYQFLEQDVLFLIWG